MAISVADNFSYQGPKPLDARAKYATVAAMKAATEATLYDGIQAYVSETDKYYKYLSTNTVDEVTGRWREYQSGGGSSVSPYTSDPAMNGTASAGVSDNYSRGDHVHPSDTSKVDKVSGKGLSTNDYDNTEKAKVGKAYLTDDTAETALADNDKIPFYDTSASGKRSSTWSNIKSVLKAYFDTLYSTVKTRGTPTSGGTALSLVTTGDMYNWNNPSVPIVANQFDKANIYSTTEKVVGCWTDGRPLYQKVVACGALPANTSKDVAHGISNLGLVIKGYLIVKHASAGVQISVPFINPASANANIGVKVNATNITITDANTDYATAFPDSYAILQYTKTTDAANSFKYADENDYSTTEHIVGSWIDGKPVYQKTIVIGALVNNSSKTVSHGISNLGAVVDAVLVGMKNGGALVTAYDTLDNNQLFTFRISSSDIIVYSKSDRSSGWDSWVTIKYTKSTD